MAARAGECVLPPRRLPGLTRTARCNIYYENGVGLDRAPGYIAHSLAEQAGTGAYHPADRAVDGVLWI